MSATASPRQSGQLATMHGDGLQTRDFIHVDDVVEANLRATVHGGSGRPYNVGTGQRLSIQKLAETVREVIGGTEQVEITHVEGRAGDIERSQAAIDRARTELEFGPAVSLEDGLRDLVSG